MRDYRLLSIGVLLAAGCSAASPFATTVQTPVPLGAQVASSASAPGRSAPSQGLPPGAGSLQSATPTRYTPGAEKPPNPFLASLRSTTASIGDALTIQPKVTPASDPTSLSGQPIDIGADLHFHAAQVYESKQNIPGAISHFEKALQKSPHDPKILAGFGRLYDRQGDLQRAQGLYQQALQVDPDNCAALNALGICSAKQGDLDAAVAHLSRAGQLQPQNARYKNNLANVLADAGRIDEAYAQLVSAHGEAGAHYNLGYFLLNQGKPDPARNEFRLALQANPYMEQARGLLNSIDAAPAAVQPTNVGYEAPGQYSLAVPANPEAANKWGPAWQAGAQGTQPGPRALPAP